MVKLILPKIRSTYHLLFALFVIWVLAFIYHERYAPYYAVKKCLWPGIENGTIRNENKLSQNDESLSDGKVTNIMFIADPQLIDNHTYPGRNELLLDISKHTADVYLKRNYNALLKQLKPDYIFFLGDYLDNGRSSTDEYFSHELDRFHKIFNKQEYIKDENFMTSVAGNHDIGWADGVKLHSRKRFIENFGNPNNVKVINNVEFITLDTISLSSQQEDIYKESRDFFDSNYGDSNVKTKPRILLTHVPLYRDTNKVTCGPIREKPIFQLTAGYQYQLIIGLDTTQELLNRIQPDIVFGGDDHDYCDINHPSVNGNSAREITVKSISMAMGIKYPAVQLLSFTNSESTSQDDYLSQNNFHYSTDLCYTQTPYINIFSYVILAVVSGLLILWCDIKHRSSRYNYTILPVSISSSNSKKLSNFLKEQDENKPVSNLISLPQYTFTESTSSFDIKKFFEHAKFSVGYFMKKWNLLAFIKHSTVFGLFIIALYYIGFCCTL